MKTAKMIMMGLLGGGSASWQDVAVPDAAFAYVPFTIQQSGRRFRAAPVFNLQAHANITVAKTYYLNTVTGLDANSGLTDALPKKTWNAIMGTGDYDRIIIQHGSYLLRSESSIQPSRNVEVIGEGSVYFTADRVNNLGAWSLAAGQTKTFQSTIAGGEFISCVYDESAVDGFGKYRGYTSRASIALVEANPGSYYWVGGVLYVHTLDDLTPSGRADLRYYDSRAVGWSKDNLVFYFENINFRGGVNLNNASVAGTATKAYLKGCTGHSLTIMGISEMITQNCEFYTAAGDVANYDHLNGVVTKAIEIDCDYFDSGSDTTNQASTAHNACIVVRMGGKYHHVTGQCVAEGTSPVKAWMMGCELYNSNSGIGYYTPGTSWLDCCWSHDNANFDLQNAAGSTIYIHDFIGAKGVNNILGTLTPY
jgi:hypothetical protein